MRLEGIVTLLLLKPSISLVSKSTSSLVLNSYKVSLLGSVLRLSSLSTYLFYFLSFYDISATIFQKLTTVLIYFFYSPVLSHLGSFVVSTNVATRPKTIEYIWPSAAWQEREAVEMVGASFYWKRDSRSLFLLPVFLLTPLKKVFPTSGYYELTRCYFGGYSFTRLS